jgi:hypothetical protein
MIFLHRLTTVADSRQVVDIAVVEDARHAVRYETRGYSRCTPEEFREAWRLRDERTLAQLHAMVGPPVEQAVGQPRIYNAPS